MSQKENLTKLLEDFLKTGPVGCGAVICKDGEEIFSGCTGFADQENGIPMTKDTIVRLYSNTKVFTNVTLMTLYEKGKFLLNDPVEKYLPEFANPKVGFFTGNGVYTVRPAERSIRVQDLMTMSSGLTYDAGIAGGTYSMTHIKMGEALAELEASGGYTVRDFTRRISEVPLLFDPGTSWCYSYSHDVLGALIEVLADEEFESYMKRAVLSPLGLKDTAFFITEDKADRLAKLYTPRDSDGQNHLVTNQDRAYQASHKFKSGGGGLLSTLNDFSKFAEMLAMGGTLDGQRILGRKTIDLMRENHLDTNQLKAFQACHRNGWEFLAGYGYGLGVRTLISKVEAGSNSTLGEFGWAGAAGTYLSADPQERFSVVYAQQVLPNPYEGYCHPRLRAAAYSILE